MTLCLPSAPTVHALYNIWPDVQYVPHCRIAVNWVSSNSFFLHQWRNTYFWSLLDSYSDIIFCIIDIWLLHAHYLLHQFSIHHVCLSDIPHNSSVGDIRCFIYIFLFTGFQVFAYVLKCFLYLILYQRTITVLIYLIWIFNIKNKYSIGNTNNKQFYMNANNI